jgi:uncharacterized protein (DUF4415 family)
MSKLSQPSTRKTTPTRGRADLSRLRRATDSEITRTSPPALPDLPECLWQDVRVVSPVTKQAISIRLDQDALDSFRASGPRYQSHVPAVRRQYVEHVAAAMPPPRKRVVYRNVAAGSAVRYAAGGRRHHPHVVTVPHSRDALCPSLVSTVSASNGPWQTNARCASWCAVLPEVILQLHRARYALVEALRQDQQTIMAAPPRRLPH